MNAPDESKLEALLRSFTGPEPRSEVRRAIIDHARQALAEKKTKAATLKSTANAAECFVITSQSSFMTKYRLMMAIAATVCLIIGIWWFEVIRFSSPTLGEIVAGEAIVLRNKNSLQACPGFQLYAGDSVETSALSDLRLADGSFVKLDAKTSIQIVAPAKGERVRLSLAQGRAFFRVVSAPGTFIIKGSGEARVLGTIFGLEEIAGKLSVNVLDGLVAISSCGKELKLSRGMSGLATKSNSPIETNANPEAALFWARERIRFENRPLSEVLDWISVNSSFRFKLNKSSVSNQRVSISVTDQAMREVIEALLLSSGLNYIFNGMNVTIE